MPQPSTSLVFFPNASVKAWASHGNPRTPSLRAAVLEKMPLVERSDPQVNEEGKEKQTGAQPLEATAPVPTQPQVRRWEALRKEDYVGVHTLP